MVTRAPRSKGHACSRVKSARSSGQPNDEIQVRWGFYLKQLELGNLELKEAGSLVCGIQCVPSVISDQNGKGSFARDSERD